MGKLPFELIQREILIKREAETDLNLGCYPDKRTTEELADYGIINLDKPKGPTSHQVSDFVQKILHIRKSGHSGTLDPAVTGILPVAIGRATRIVEVLLKAGKEYVGVMHLHKDIDEKLIRKVCNEFIGKIIQKPPLRSSVKRVEREREIYYLEIMEIDGKDVLFKAGTQAGTYIRKLCHDIGEKLKIGAHMAELRRTKVGPFLEDTKVTLQDLTDAYHYWKSENNEKLLRKCIQPIENAVKHIPKIWVLDSAVNSLTHGMDLKIPGIVKLESGIEPENTVAVMTLKDELIGIGIAKLSSEIIMKEEKGIAVKIHKVFMLSDFYKQKS